MVLPYYKLNYPLHNAFVSTLSSMSYTVGGALLPRHSPLHAGGNTSLSDAWWQRCPGTAKRSTALEGAHLFKTEPITLVCLMLNIVQGFEEFFDE